MNMNFSELVNAFRAADYARQDLEFCRQNGTAPRDVLVGYPGGSVSLARLALNLGMKAKNGGAYYD
jgi:hypothetical protein